MPELPIGPEELAVLTSEIMAKVRSEIGIPKLVPATVAADSTDVSIVSVLIDGDSSGIPRTAENLLLCTLAADARVMVLFEPPRGIFVAGLVSGTQWTDYTPQIDQGASTDIAKTVTTSRYIQLGRTVIWNFSLAVTAAGTAGSAITLTLPVSALVTGTTSSALGAGNINDVSVARYVGSWGFVPTQRIQLLRDGSASAVGLTPSFALASGDFVFGTVTYEAA